MHVYLKQLSMIAAAIILLASCASRQRPEERVASWEDWELCHRLADFVYKGESQWLWYASKEITTRNLANDQRCKSIYEARMNAYIRKNERADISVSFIDAIKSKPALNELSEPPK